MAQAAKDAERVLQRRVEPLLKLFHDETFSLLNMLQHEFEAEEEPKLAPVRRFWEKLNEMLQECDRLKSHARKVGGAAGLAESSDEEEEFN